MRAREMRLELMEDVWSSRDDVNLENRRSSNIFSSVNSLLEAQPQTLDARSLLASRILQAEPLSHAYSITPPSSIDLEWEPEGCLPLNPMHFKQPSEEECDSVTTNDKNGATATGPNSVAWSRVSTPDSLEWDPVEAPLTAAPPAEEYILDEETEQLLNEIERLTERALRETGDWRS